MPFRPNRITKSPDHINEQPDGFVTIRVMLARLFAFIFLLIPVVLSAQAPDAILATAKGKTFTQSVLSPDGQRAFANQKAEIETARTNLLSQMIG